MNTRPKANLTQIFDNHKSLQFSKMFYDLSYKNTGLKSSQQQMLAILIDRMQLSIKNSHFDKVKKRYYVNMCNKEISDITGDSEGTVSKKMNHLAKLGYLDIVQRKNHTNDIFLNFYHTCNIDPEKVETALFSKNEFEYLFYLPSDSKITKHEFKNRKAALRKSQTSHSTYPYLHYSERVTNRLESTKDKNISNDVVSNPKDNSNKDSVDHSIKNKKQNKDIKQKHNQIVPKHFDSYEHHEDLITQLKLKEQHALPNRALDIIESYVRSLNHSMIGNKDIMEKYLERIFWAKDDASKAYDAKDILTWENTPQMIEDFNNQINRWLILSDDKSNKTWEGYFYKCIYNFFVEIVKRVRGDNNPKFTYTKQGGFSKVKNNSNQQQSQHRIKEKLPDWAKKDYKPKFKKIDPKLKKEIQERLRKLDDKLDNNVASTSNKQKDNHDIQESIDRQEDSSINNQKQQFDHSNISLDKKQALEAQLARIDKKLGNNESSEQLINDQTNKEKQQDDIDEDTQKMFDDFLDREYKDDQYSYKKLQS